MSNASARAATIAAALLKRIVGSLARQRIITAESGGRMSGLNKLGGGGGVVMCCIIIAVMLSPRNGGTPVQKSKKTTTHQKKSLHSLSNFSLARPWEDGREPCRG